MIRYISILFTVIITSMYFFPFEFRFLPGMNTKMIMASIGLLLIIVRMARLKISYFDKEFFVLSIWAIVVSLVGFTSVVYNDTLDYTYATYVISMFVWCGGAYTLISLIREIHGIASIFLLCNYLIVVCVMQCILAMMINKIPAFEEFVNNIVGGLGFVDMDDLADYDRLYGIGASLDVAGSRFSAVLVMIAYVLTEIYKTKYKNYIVWYLVTFVIISIIGNMMARTTTVGIGLFFMFILYKSRIYLMRLSESVRKLFLWLGIILMITIPVTVYLYNTDYQTRSNLRFAFEGFFSLAEKGEWDVHSNKILKNMYVLPDNPKTWIIGDGYFDNPASYDPYYIGVIYGGFYHGTDVGYLRFIYYFGIIGLFCFCMFMLKAGQIVTKRFEKEKLMLWVVLAVNFIVWFKVSTDIFLVFALFLCINKEENDEYNKSILLDKAE